MANAAEDGDKYAAAYRERQEYFDAILASKASKKIVVAGPGTGKTYLFKAALRDKSNTLTLTFINSLVQDLSLELCGISEVRTLHGFARRIVSKATGSAAIYQRLSNVIAEDAAILLGQTTNFENMMFEMDETNPLFDFYAQRRGYYNHYGQADIVFAAVKYFGADDKNIPAFEQVVVDEFQDFNKLEVALIELLGRKSPMLLAGDDDQALYDFKHASPSHIRILHQAKKKDQESFSLPYCSRCTRVIIESVNDLIAGATKAGLLKDRIKKAYDYFDDKDKDRDCETYKTLSYSQCYPAQIPWFIEKSVGELAADVRGSFSVLVIAPTTTQCRTLTKALRKKGFKNVSGIEPAVEGRPLLVDGLKILLNDSKSNLGWRIVCKEILDDETFKALLKKASGDKPNNFEAIVDKEHKGQVKALLGTLRKVANTKEVEKDDLIVLLEEVRIDPLQVAMEKLKEQMSNLDDATANASIRSIPIKVTTIQRSKGLAADFVFIAYFDDQYFIRNRDKSIVSDHDACSLLVALTRARKKAFLISTRSQKPTFLNWIKKERYD